MAVSLVSTGVQFPDSTIQTTAASGGALPRSARTSNTILGTADRSTLIAITSGTFTQTFTAAATLGSGWFCYIQNQGTGYITLDPNASELIDGVTSYVMYPGECRLVQCTGTAFNTVIVTPLCFTATTTFTFTKPPGYNVFTVAALGGGGGGGSGPIGNGNTGGAGGGGGSISSALLAAGDVSASTTVTIGAGGAGGTSSSGANGGTSSFGDLVKGYGGGSGQAGSSGQANGGGGGGALAAASGSAAGGPFYFNGSSNTFVDYSGDTGSRGGQGYTNLPMNMNTGGGGGGGCGETAGGG